MTYKHKQHVYLAGPMEGLTYEQMSEWFDNQKKPSSSFHKLQQERIEKSNLRRQL